MSSSSVGGCCQRIGKESQGDSEFHSHGVPTSHSYTQHVEKCKLKCIAGYELPWHAHMVEGDDELTCDPTNLEFLGVSGKRTG